MTGYIQKIKFPSAPRCVEWMGWVLISFAIFALPTTLFAEDYEANKISISASELVNEEMMSGPHYRLEEEAFIEGYMNNYTVRSDFGTFSAESDFDLRVLIREVAAIAELQKISKTEAFAEAMANAAKAPIEVAQKVVTEPVETVKKIPAGVGRLLKRTARAVSDAAGTLEKKSRDKGTNKGDSGDRTKTSDKVVKSGKKFTRDQLGVNSAMRKLAKDLKVDPYSSNPILQKEMNSVAWAMAGGSFATSKFVSMPDEIGSVAELSNLVWDTDPLDLQLRNEKLLAEMGADEALITSFFDNAFFTTTSQTLLVGSLASLGSVKGRTTLVRDASEAESQQEAEFYTQIARLLVDYGKSRSPVTHLFGSMGLPFALTKNGTMALFVPVDYLLWTQQVSEAANRITEQMQQAAPHQTREIWVLGRISSKAQTGLASAGFKVFDRSEERLR